MKHLQKSLSLFLCIVLCLLFFPFTPAYAEENIEEVESVSEAEELESSPQAIKVADKNSAALIFKKFLNCIGRLLVQDIEFLFGRKCFANHAQGILAGGEGEGLEFKVGLLFTIKIAGRYSQHALSEFVDDFDLHELRVTYGQVKVAVQTINVNVHLG